MHSLPVPNVLWHYTCQHGRNGIGDTGELRVGGHGLIWLTDLADVDRDALGLTSRILYCDRTAYRYRVLDVRNVLRYTDVRRSILPTLMREGIESAGGAMPRHWFVSRHAVPVVFDPERVRT